MRKLIVFVKMYGSFVFKFVKKFETKNYTQIRNKI